MYFKITYKVNGMEFVANTPYVSEAYDMVKAIIKAEKLMFPDQKKHFLQLFRDSFRPCFRQFAEV